MLQKRVTIWSLLAAGATAVLPYAVVSAQDIDSSPESTGVPRNIVPPGELRPDTPRRTPLPSPVPRPNAGSPVQIGELGALEGPTAATMMRAVTSRPIVWTARSHSGLNCGPIVMP